MVTNDSPNTIHVDLEDILIYNNSYTAWDLPNHFSVIGNGPTHNVSYFGNVSASPGNYHSNATLSASNNTYGTPGRVLVTLDTDGEYYVR